MVDFLVLAALLIFLMYCIPALRALGLGCLGTIVFYSLAVLFFIGMEGCTDNAIRKAIDANPANQTSTRCDTTAKRHEKTSVSLSVRGSSNDS